MKKKLVCFIFLAMIVLGIVLIFQSDVRLSPKSKNLQIGDVVKDNPINSLFIDNSFDSKDVDYFKVINFYNADYFIEFLNYFDELSKQEKKEKLEKIRDSINLMNEEQKIEIVEDLFLAKESFPDLRDEEFKDIVPQLIDIKNTPLMRSHSEEFRSLGEELGQATSLPTEYFIIKENEIFSVKVFGEISSSHSLSDNGLLYNGQIYLRVVENKENEQENSPITGHQIYNPTTPFNAHPFNIAVILPYSASIPLPANYLSYLSPILQNVQQYYSNISDGQTLFNFTLYPIPYSASVTPSDIPAIIAAGDPFIDYSSVDMAMVIQYHSYYSGFATATFVGNTPYYFNTNEGPVPSAVPVVFMNFVSPSGIIAEMIIEHEIGHVLSFWNPQVNPNVLHGMVPHANGLFPFSCTPSSTGSICNAVWYGDILSVMGFGEGSFSYHQRSYFMGISPTSDIQTITGSGTHTLCDINHPSPVGCPRQLTIDNPFGIDIALELRTNSGPEALFSCPNSFFDGVLVRAVNLEQGGTFGNTVFSVWNIPFFQVGEVILPYSYSQTLCPNYVSIPGINPYPGIFDYPVPVGGVMNSQLGDITVNSITSLPSGGKQASITFNNNPLCVASIPSISISPHSYNDIYNVLVGNKFILVNNVGSPQVTVMNNDLCNSGPGTFVVTTTGTIGGQSFSSSLTVQLTPQQSTTIDIPLPSSLSGITGQVAITVSISKVSNPTHSASAQGTLNLLTTTPQVYGPYGISYCNDHDSIPFTWQTLGANFLTPPGSNGGDIILNPPISGFPTSSFFVPDVCTGQGVQSTDVVCGSIVGIPSIQNNTYVVVKDCRLVMNNSLASCFVGQCI